VSGRVDEVGKRREKIWESVGRRWTSTGPEGGGGEGKWEMVRDGGKTGGVRDCLPVSRCVNIRQG